MIKIYMFNLSLKFLFLGFFFLQFFKEGFIGAVNGVENMNYGSIVANIIAMMEEMISTS